MKADNTDRFLIAADHTVAGMTKDEESAWTGPFTFVQMADCQLGMYEHNASWDREVLQLQHAVRMINALHPRFVIVCGDLTNAEPNNPAYPHQVDGFKRAMSDIDSDIPLVCLCGNHDVGNTPTAESIESYIDNFGDHYFSFWVSGVHCIVLNSNLFCDPSQAQELQDEQLAWLDNQLQPDASGEPVHRLVFTHHSWFIREPLESDHYFAIPRMTRVPMLQKFLKAGVTACFAGHYHRNAVAIYEGMEMITTSAVGMPLGQDPPGFRIVHVQEDHIEHDYILLGISEVESDPIPQEEDLPHL